MELGKEKSEALSYSDSAEGTALRGSVPRKIFVPWKVPPSPLAPPLQADALPPRRCDLIKGLPSAPTATHQWLRSRGFSSWPVNEPNFSSDCRLRRGIRSNSIHHNSGPSRGKAATGLRAAGSFVNSLDEATVNPGRLTEFYNRGRCY